MLEDTKKDYCCVVQPYEGPFFASDDQQLAIGAAAKLQEYLKLQYPLSTLRRLCHIMAFNTGNSTWKNFIS